MTPKQAKAKADRIFSKIVRTTGQCERCGTRNNLQCAHWISRRYAWTRTNLDNAFCLCAACHRWGHDRPTEFSEWAIGMRGEYVYEQIRALSYRRDKFDWIQELTRLEELCGGC